MDSKYEKKLVSFSITFNLRSLEGDKSKKITSNIIKKWSETIILNSQTFFYVISHKSYKDKSLEDINFCFYCI